MPDLVQYRFEILYAYQPKQIFIYCGEDDVAASDTVSEATVVSRFITLFGLLRAKYKTVPVAYVSMKPSPSRLHLLSQFREANQLIMQYLATQTKTTFVDVYHALKGRYRDERYFPGGPIDMNAKGYAIWKKRI